MERKRYHFKKVGVNLYFADDVAYATFQTHAGFYYDVKYLGKPLYFIEFDDGKLLKTNEGKFVWTTMPRYPKNDFLPLFICDFPQTRYRKVVVKFVKESTLQNYDSTLIDKDSHYEIDVSKNYKKYIFSSASDVFTPESGIYYTYDSAVDLDGNCIISEKIMKDLVKRRDDFQIFLRRHNVWNFNEDKNFHCRIEGDWAWIWANASFSTGPGYVFSLYQPPEKGPFCIGCTNEFTYTAIRIVDYELYKNPKKFLDFPSQFFLIDHEKELDHFLSALEYGTRGKSKEYSHRTCEIITKKIEMEKLKFEKISKNQHGETKLETIRNIERLDYIKQPYKEWIENFNKTSKNNERNL